MSTVSVGNAPESPPKEPLWFTAFFGSLACTGLGHLMIGRVQRGVVWLVFGLGFIGAIYATLAVWADIQVVVCVALAACVFRVASIVDALICARRPRWNYGTPLTRALIVMTVGIGMAFIVTAPLLILRAWILEGYRIPTNAMMPSLIGETVWGQCQKCGHPTPVVAPMREFRDPRWREQEMAGICTHCGALLDARAFPAEDDPPRRSDDRIVGNKLIEPRRWDMIIFRFPEDPSVTFVKRLVGLPGERVELKNGEVTINGKVMPKPPHLKFLHYVDAQSIDPIAFRRGPGAGDSGNPVTLGPDEYYVLGDFSQRSKDSRLWDRGAPGHPPYAVPRDHIIGVVSHIYWPPDRWRTFERADDKAP